jgi:hypothetical protein
MADPTDEEIDLANELLAAWDSGRGQSKSELEREHWGDGSSHGRRFDRFIRQTLGVSTSRPSKQTDQIGDLQTQVRRLGQAPVGTDPPAWEVQLLHAREACLAGLRIWNDPAARFRTGSFALLFVAAWNSLAIAALQRSEAEWRKLDEHGLPCYINAVDQSEATSTLVANAFPDAHQQGLRANVGLWIDLRNAVAHRHLPALDVMTIPLAQAGLLNFEEAIVREFGNDYGIGDCLSVPLQLSGFRDPGVLHSAKALHAGLPLDVQAVLSRPEEASPELLADPTFTLRIAFIPTVPASGRRPDAVAYFVKPGEVPDELNEMVEQYLVLPKVGMTARPNLSASEVMAEVERRTSFKFHSGLHAEAARRLGVRPPAGLEECTLEIQFAEYITSFKRYLYSQAWIDRLVAECAEPDGFLRTTGTEPKPVDHRPDRPDRPD